MACMRALDPWHKHVKRLRDLLNHEIPNREGGGDTLAEATSPHRHIHTKKHLNTFCKSTHDCVPGIHAGILGMNQANLNIFLDKSCLSSFKSISVPVEAFQ